MPDSPHQPQSTPTAVPLIASTLPRFLFVPVSGAAMVALALDWPSAAWPVRALWTLVAAYGLFCWTSCFHEAAHLTLCGSRSVSLVLGRIIGTMIFVPLHVYRESHIRHHAYLNKPLDWELWPYSDPNASLWFRRLFCWSEFPLGVFTSPFVYGRLYFHKNSPIRNPKLRRTIRNEYIVIVLVWTVILGTVAFTSSWRLFLLVWGAPHFLAAMMQTVRKFTEHLGMRSYDPLLGTRTVIGTKPFTQLSTFLNFDIFVHGPHHRHPRYRHEALCDRMAAYQRENADVAYPVFSTYWQAIRDVIPVLVRNPGVGMNVGAAAPGEEQPHDISDFSEDVTAEILNADDAVIPAGASPTQPVA